MRDRSFLLLNIQPAVKAHRAHPTPVQLRQDALLRLAIFREDEKLAGETLQNLQHGGQLATLWDRFRQGEETLQLLTHLFPVRCVRQHLAQGGGQRLWAAA